MPKNQGNRNNNNGSRKRQAAGGQLDEQNPIVQAFRSYANELNGKHDRHERIVKMSRDITIESKRVIFLLHSIDSRKQNKAKVLEEAAQRLDKLIGVNFRAIALELRDQDVYQFRNAYSPGLQEFIEAYTYMEFLRYEEDDEQSKPMSHWTDLQSIMQFELEKKEDDKEENPQETEEQEAVDKVEKFHFHVVPTEYILGLSDLTGELMRRCINSLGSGDTETCFEICKALQQFYTCYIKFNCHRAPELWRKIYTMKQSMMKAENVCYNVKVRGGEAAKSANLNEKPSEDTDEGFY